MRILRTVAASLLILLVGFVLLAMRPVPAATNENCEVVTGKIVEVAEGGTKDLVFQLENDPHIYYFNRGLERGLRLAEVRKSEGKVATLYYIRHWTPLSGTGKVKPLAKVVADGVVLFDTIGPDN